MPPRTRQVAVKVADLAWRECRDRLRRRSHCRAVEPGMRYREMDIVEEILQALKPRRCLEWGAGYSTLRFPSILPWDAHWLAVEHDEAWAARMTGLLRDPRTEVVRIAPDHQPWSDPHGDGTRDDLASYVGFPGSRGPFDFVLVDGRARKDCLIEARSIVDDRGIVVLHDANRIIYHEPFSLYQHHELFWTRLIPHRRRAGGIWVGSPSRPIAEVLDVPRHRMIWKACRLLGRAIPC